MAASSEQREQSEESLSSPSSPASSEPSSPETPTNKDNEAMTSNYKKENLVPKLEVNESPSISPSPCSNGTSSQDGYQIPGAAESVPLVGNYGNPGPNTGQQLPPTMLLPPYMTDLKGQQGAEGISLSSYVKLMTLQQQGGYGVPGATFHPPGVLSQGDPQELSAIPTTLPPQYQDMSYHAQCLLVNQTQQLNTLAGFQHPLAKASSTPGLQASGTKLQEDKPPVYQQELTRIQGAASNSGQLRNGGQIRRRTVKRSHGQSLEHGDDSEIDLSDRGSVFPLEGDGSDRQPLTSDFVTSLGLSGEKHTHQLKWRAHMVETWQGVCDAALIDIPSIGFHVETDKGFNFSIIDDSFVCQKKNHFQVTVSVLFHRTPKFVKLKNGSIQPIERFTLNLHGIRFEQVNSSIQLEQSRSDRSKIRYHPDIIEIPENPEKPLKRTVCRLHFSETTQNNMRKRGKPNPDQKHFSLVVALHAETPEGSLPVVAHVSERIVVRASNPGNFDSDSDYLWYKSTNPENIFHHGRVGINTDKPDEALTVHGNIQVTGQILQVSDSRVKRNIQPVEPHHHLDNISKLQLYYYQLDNGVVASGVDRGCGLMMNKVGVATNERRQVGLLAQEVRQVIPDAVMETDAEASLDGGGHVSNLLMVDKDQVLMTTIGAVQELRTLSNELSQQLNSLQNTKHEACQCTHPIRTEQLRSWTVNIVCVVLVVLLWAYTWLF